MNKYIIIYYNPYGQDYGVEYVIAENKEDAETVFNQHYKGYDIEHTRDYCEPEFLTKKPDFLLENK